jgi:hypothetical protein
MAITQNPRIVGAVRRLVAWPNRRARLAFVSGPLMRAMARVAMRRAGVTPAADLDQLFERWQRSSPALADYRLTEIRDDTVLAEIHSNCALRGSGDVAACHRMMEYDREVMRAVGGELVVLQSQATPGRTFCTVVMRRAGASMADFTPAHRAHP